MNFLDGCTLSTGGTARMKRRVKKCKILDSTLRKRRNMLSKLRTKPMYEIENVGLEVKFLFCKSYGRRWAKEASSAPAATLDSSICFQT